VIVYSLIESVGSLIWIGNPNSSSSSKAFIEAFWMIKFVIPIYSGELYFLSFCTFNNSLIDLASPDKNKSPSIDTPPNSTYSTSKVYVNFTVSFASLIFSIESILMFVFISSLPLKSGFLSAFNFVILEPANFRFVMLRFDNIGL